MVAEEWLIDLVPQQGMFSDFHESFCKGENWTNGPLFFWRKKG